jgi:hypothetical protein
VQTEEQTRKINKIIAKAWLDEGFKKKLLADPTASFKDEGVEIPPGVEVRIAEDTNNVRHVLLPLRPPAEEASDELLTEAARGRGICARSICNSCASL